MILEYAFLFLVVWTFCAVIYRLFVRQTIMSSLRLRLASLGVDLDELEAHQGEKPGVGAATRILRERLDSAGHSIREISVPGLLALRGKDKPAAIRLVLAEDELISSAGKPFRQINSSILSVLLKATLVNSPFASLGILGPLGLILYARNLQERFNDYQARLIVQTHPRGGRPDGGQAYA